MAENSHKIKEGCTVYQRPESKRGVWMYYVKIGDAKPVRRSTGKTNLSEAIKVAEEKFDEIKDRLRRGQSVTVPTFRAAITDRIADRIAEVDADERRKKMDKTAATNRRGDLRRSIDYWSDFVERFLGKQTTLDHIGQVEWKGYLRYRQELRDIEIFEREEAYRQRREDMIAKWGESSRVRKYYKDVDEYLDRKLPSATEGRGALGVDVSHTAYATEYAILRDFVEWCQTKKWLTAADEPKLPKIKTTITPRFGFEDAEMQELVRVAKRRALDTQRRVKKAPHLQAELDSRVRVWHAITILAATGMRPKHLCELRVRNVIKNPTGSGERDFGGMRDMSDEKLGFYAFAVTSHKGEQSITMPVVPESWALPTIDNMLQFKKPGDFLIGGNSGVLGKAIKKAIKAADLEIGQNDEYRTMYSLRHGYITKQLINDVAPVIVARNVLSSLEMVERHYNHMSSLHNFKKLSGH